MFTKLSRETKKWVAYLLMAAIIFSDAGLVKAGDVSTENYNTEGNVIYSDVYHDYSDSELYDSGYMDYAEGVIVEDGTVEESAVFATSFEDNNTDNTKEAVSTENETVCFESEKDSSGNKEGILKYIDDLKEEKNNATPKKNLVNEIIEAIENGVKYIIYGSEDNVDLPVGSGGVSGNFTVSFNMNDGTGAIYRTETSVSADSIILEPTAPTRAGYTFSGWYKEAGCTNEWIFASDTVTEDTTLYAKWTIKTYKVTFHVTNGTLSLSSTDVKYGNAVTMPTVTPDPGHKINEKWYKDAGLTVEYNVTDPVTEALDLYAKCEETTPTKYTVTFDTQGGSTVPSQTVSVNELATKPTPDPTKTGYTFGGWYKDSKCTDGNEWNFDTEIKSDITLFAKWTAIEYSISCNTAEHGTIKASVSKATAGTEVTITGTPEDGYVLKSIKVNGGEDIPAQEDGKTAKFIMPAADATVTATFVKLYKIVADSSIKNADVIITPDKQIAGGIVKIKVAPKTGYYVKTVSANGTNIKSTSMPTDVEKGSTIEKNDYVMPAEDVVITAEVEKIDYTITKTATNATISVTGSKEKANYGDTVEFTVSPLADNEIGLVEVIKNRDKSEVSYDVTAGTYSFTMPAGEVTINVIAGKKHKLEISEDMKTVSANGAISLSTGEGDIVSGNKITATVTPKTGYRVKRDGGKPYIIVRAGGVDSIVWATNPANPNEFVFNMPDADAVVLAEFEPIPKWTVSFNMIPADVSTQKIEPQKDVEDGTIISAPEVTPVTGYKLYGWYKDSECTEANKWDFSTDKVTANITLYAKWVKLHTVTFNMLSHGTQIAPVTNVENGRTISKPSPEPTDTDYIFGGWYKEEDCANVWNFATDVVVKDMTLYAKWIKSAPEPGKVSVLFGRLAYDYDELATYNIASKLTILQGTKKIADISVDEDIEKGAVELLPGDYVLTEKDTPYSYEKAADVNFSITSDGTVMIGDEPATYFDGKQIVELISAREYTYAVFEKLDDEGGFVEGANLDIYKAIDVDVYENENGEYKEIDIAGEPVDSIVNTARGFYEQIGLHEDKTKHLKYGEHYVIYESKTPEGYLQACPLEFFIQADLVSKSDIVYVWNYKDGYVQEEIYFEETDLWLDREPQHPCVVMVDIKMSNPTVKIRVVDEDSNDDYDLKDATVVIISDEDGKVVDDWISDGKIFEKKLTPGKKYTLTMEKAPVGYSSVRDDIEFEVGEDGKVYVYGEKQKDNCLYLSARLEYDVDTLVPVSIKKITGAGQHLSGAELAIYDYYQDGAVVGGIWRPTSKSVTSVTLYDATEDHIDLGEAFFTSTGKMEYALFPQHKYVLYELNAPSLYEVAEPVEFTMGYVTNENKNVNLPTSVQMIDKISSSVMTTVYIRKLASNTKSWLKGAVLYVYPVDGESKFDMNNQATYTAKIITNGTNQPVNVNYYKYYVLRETAAPSGYAVAGDITFCVKEDGVYVNGQRLADNTPITMIDMYTSSSKSDKDDDDDNKKDKSSSSSTESNITNGSPLVISGGTAGTPSTVAPGTSSLPAAGTPGGLKGVYPTTVNIGGVNVTVDPATFYQTVEYLVANKNNVPQNVKNLVDAYIDKILEVNPNFFDNASAAVKGYVLGRRRGKLPQTGGFVGTPSMYLLALLILMMGLWLVVYDKKRVK